MHYLLLIIFILASYSYWNSSLQQFAQKLTWWSSSILVSYALKHKIPVFLFQTIWLTSEQIFYNHGPNLQNIDMMLGKFIIYKNNGQAHEHSIFATYENNIKPFIFLYPTTYLTKGLRLLSLRLIESVLMWKLEKVIERKGYRERVLTITVRIYKLSYLSIVLKHTAYLNNQYM